MPITMWDQWIYGVVQTWAFWLCVTPIIGAFVLGVYFSITDNYGDWFEGVVIAPVVTAFGAAVVWWIICALGMIFLPHYDHTSRHDLMAINDRYGPNGAFFLGSGQIDGDPAFAFYTDEGGYAGVHEILASPTVRIYQDIKPGETPWLVTFDDCNLWGKLTTCWLDHGRVNEVHVPPGTIKPSLNLDAK